MAVYTEKLYSYRTGDRTKMERHFVYRQSRLNHLIDKTVSRLALWKPFDRLLHFAERFTKDEIYTPCVRLTVWHYNFQRKTRTVLGRTSV